jgi:hypothetical protein
VTTVLISARPGRSGRRSPGRPWPRRRGLAEGAPRWWTHAAPELRRARVFERLDHHPGAVGVGVGRVLERLAGSAVAASETMTSTGWTGNGSPMSIPTTVAPWSSKQRETCEPTKPAAPVTSTRVTRSAVQRVERV